MSGWLATLIDRMRGMLGRRPVPPRRPICVDFAAWTPSTAGPNPIHQAGVMFRVRDATGNAVGATRIWNMGNCIGLDCGYSVELAFPDARRIEATLCQFARPAEIEAWERLGTSAGTAVMTVGQNTAETLVLTGTRLYRGLIKAPQDEVILVRFCYEPA